MRISILDDYHDTLRALDGFTKLPGHDVDDCNDPIQDVDALVERLRESERSCSFVSAPRSARRWRSPLIHEFLI